ncbi:carotenoid oxygenase family protein [Kaistia dalseonensis]|uniref:carotenoid oxygenase family protein n=1 Tax=Kaistia dalseonensis TaxID=410840 RepID=UPI00351F94C6
MISVSRAVGREIRRPHGGRRGAQRFDRRPNASVIHDVAITENHVVWFDPSVALDHQSGRAFPYTWQDSYRARIGVIPRDRSKGVSSAWTSFPIACCILPIARLITSRP